MLKSKRSEYVAAAVLMAPFVVVYGVLFVYPTIKMVELSFTNAPLIGPGQWVGFDNYWRLATERQFPTRGLEHHLLRAPVGAAEHPSRPGRRARRESPQGVGAERGARRLLPALYPAGVGRLAHLELDVRQGFRHRTISHRPAQRRTTSLDLPHHTLVHADGRSGDHLVAVGVQRAAVRRRPAQHLQRDLRGRRARRRQPLGAVLAHHLAADLAGDRARFHDPAHPAVQDFRSGLSVHAGGLPGRHDDGDGPIYFPAGVPVEQGRPRRGGFGRSLPPDHGHVGVAVPALRGEGGDDAPPSPTRSRRPPPDGSRACAISTSSASSLRLRRSRSRSPGRSRSIGGS